MGHAPQSIPGFVQQWEAMTDEERQRWVEDRSNAGPDWKLGEWNLGDPIPQPLPSKEDDKPKEWF